MDILPDLGGNLYLGSQIGQCIELLCQISEDRSVSRCCATRLNTRSDISGFSAGRKESSSACEGLEWITKDLEDMLSLSLDPLFKNSLYFGRVSGPPA